MLFYFIYDYGVLVFLNSPPFHIIYVVNETFYLIYIVYTRRNIVQRTIKFNNLYLI